MNIQRIENILSQIEANGNYKDFTNLLSLEERKQLIYYIETDPTLVSEVINKFKDDNFITNYFTEEEAANIYNNEFNELSELSKNIVICNLSLILAKEALKKYTPDVEIIRLILKKLSSDSEKMEFIKPYLSNLSDYDKFRIYARSLDEIDSKLLCMKTYPECYTSFPLLCRNVKTDEEIKKIIDFYQKNFQNYHFEYESQFEEILASMFSSFSNDNLKLQYLDSILGESNKAKIIQSLKDDNLKLQYLDIFLLELTMVRIIQSLKDDNLKLQYLTKFYEDNYKAQIILTINDLKIKVKALTFLDNITSYCIHADWLDDVENINDDINREIIRKIAEENALNYDNLFQLFLKFGYGIRTLGNNLIKIVNLSPDEFKKIIQILDIKESSKLTMNDVNNFIPTFYEREFRINNREELLIFSRLQNLILNKDRVEIINLLPKINKIVDINSILDKNNINSDTFIDNLLENENNEFLLNVLHEITNKYLNKIRNLYVAERKGNAENELNLDYDYDKNYLISKFFQKYDIQYIYNFINSEIDKSKLLDDGQRELLNNESLLIECLKFMKDKEHYPMNEFSKIKSKLKSLNGILNILYEEKKFDFLGNKKDEKAKIILKPKEVVSKDFFIKLLNELDIDLLRDKLLSNPELYEKMLNILKKYKFMNWSDTFENLLKTADLSFNERDIAILINYFYSFYSKLEAKQQNGLIEGIRLSNILDELRTYGSSSIKYDYLLGKEDSELIISNPGPNSASLKTEERLKKVPEEILIQFKRKYITVPPMDLDVSLENGKKIHVDIGDITSTINLTYGERTGACMRIGGAGSSLFDFCLENENGFHIRLTNPTTGNFISRVSGFRNGNTVFLNQLRYSLDKDISNSDLIDAIRVVARKIVELTKESEYPIKNVVISDGYVMSARHNDRTTLNVNDVKKGYSHFYSDVSSSNAIYLEKNDEIEVGPEKAEKYDVLRKRIICYENINEITEQIQKFNLINGLLKGKSLGEISIIDEKFIINISKLYVGEDFLIAFDFDGNILWKFILEREDHFKKKANEEINVLINYLKEKDLVNKGGKAR